MATQIKQTEFDLLSALPVALLVLGPDGQTIWANAHARCILGPVNDFATALNTLTADTRFDDWHKVLAGLTASDGPQQFLNINCRPIPNQPRVINLILHCMTEADATGHKSYRTLALIEDTTGLADLERQLAHSERLASLGKFSAQLAHELNNPLDGILRYVNLTLRLCDHMTDQRPSKYLLQARQGLLRIIRIVTELLEFSRSSDAALVEDRIDHIIDEVLTSFQPRAVDSQITFEPRFGPNLPFIRTGNLYQVFANLICNAIEAMPSGGTLTVAAELLNHDVVITFADTGVGLPPDAGERIFQPFFTTKPAGKGTGLGLAICREVIEKFHGTIIAADRPTGGAVITVTIPLSSCQTAADLRLPRPMLSPESAAMRPSEK